MEDYREWLQNELKARCLRNPQYSLRAFARDLNFSPAFISYVLAGQKGLSVSSATRIAKVIGFSEVDRETFCNMVNAQQKKKTKS